MISKGADPENWTDEAEQRDESSERESQVMRIKPMRSKTSTPSTYFAHSLPSHQPGR